MAINSFFLEESKYISLIHLFIYLLIFFFYFEPSNNILNLTYIYLIYYLIHKYILDKILRVFLILQKFYLMIRKFHPCKKLGQLVLQLKKLLD